MNNNQSKYFRTGWHDDLILISVPINSFARYFITCLFLIAIEISDVIIGEIAHPIIGFNIYNPDKKIITDFTKNELQLYGNTMYIIEALKRILMIVISITQIDFALYRVLFGNIASIFTIRMILNEKSYTLSNDNTKYKKEKLEENETEMV
uniref:Uncharacterized protein n=1 Tax=viral metagenome TaxID=1070528 RepID=A0A6C0JF41_9ZZZZ